MIAKLLLFTLISIALISANTCRVSIVGSGLSGVYAAFRLASSKDIDVNPYDICVFEASSEIGGRLLAINTPEGDIVELGIESFNTAKTPMFSKLVDYLGLPTECFFEESKTSEQPSQPTGNEAQPAVTQTEGTNETQPTGNETQPAVNQTEGANVSKRQDLTGNQTTGEENTGKKCPELHTAFWYLRNKVVFENLTAENLPYTVKADVDKIKNLPRLAFDKVYGNVSNLNIDELKSSQGGNDTSKLDRVREIIKSITSGDVNYKGIPVSQLSMRTILLDSEDDVTHEDIEASVMLGDKIPRMKHILDMNFELFAIQYIRDLALGEGDEKKISGFGLKTVLDVLMERCKDLGVKFFLDSKLDSFRVLRRSEVLLKFSDLDMMIPTERLILAVNRKNILEIKGFDDISLDTAEVLGNLKERRIQRGVIFYDDAWWQKLNIQGVAFTDTHLSKLSFHVSKKCQSQESEQNMNEVNQPEPETNQTVSDETNQTSKRQASESQGNKCPGHIVFENWVDDRGLLNLDTFNPVGVATVLSAFISSEKAAQSINTSEPTETQGIQSQRRQANETQPTGNETQSGSGPEVTAETEIVKLADAVKQAMDDELKTSKFSLDVVNRLISKIFETIPGFDRNSAQSAFYAVLANWAHDGIFEYGAYLLPTGVTYNQFIHSMMEPIPDAPVHLVNSDFSDWDRDLEKSIVQVERVLSNILKVKKPEWTDDNTYNSIVELD